MNNNPLVTLGELGQSVWIDTISRELFSSGRLSQLIAEDGLRGMTSNPTIFQKAVAADEEYAEELKDLVASGKSAEGIYDAVVLKDIAQAADLLKPVYDKTRGVDGFVSIEVPPQMACDTQASIREARRLFTALSRPNILVKIPGTPAGIPAIRQCLTEGININITLLFDIGNYEQVMDAYLSALEARVQKGDPLSGISSVASFFVSRIDTRVDTILNEKTAAASSSDQKEKPKKLLGKTGVANAKMAYQKFKEVFFSRRFQGLKVKGARVQRPLWASTSTKNPAYSDILYVQDLIARDSVNTMPLETLNAFRDHGIARLTIESNLEEAKAHLKALAQEGIDLTEVTKELQEEGVKLFDDSFTKLMQSIRAKREALLSGAR